MEFAERVFPYVTHNILERGDDASRTTLSEQFRNFFSYCNGVSVMASRASSPATIAEQSSVKTSGTFGGNGMNCIMSEHKYVVG